MDSGLSDYLSSVMACDRPFDVMELTQRAAQSLGCSHVGCYRGILSATPWIYSSAPAWIQAEYANNWSKRLPHSIIKDMRPQVFGTGVVRPENRNTHPAAIEMERAHAEVDALGVLALPIYSPSLERRCAFAFASFESGPMFDLFLNERRNTLTLMAHAAGMRIQQLLDDEEIRLARLSPREAECLLWLARGLRHAEVADRLSLSVSAVELYLANARRKLNAKTREQALAKAIMLGLITP